MKCKEAESFLTKHRRTVEHKQTQTILSADDDDNDVLLLKMAFAKAGLAEQLRRVKDGAEAIQYLNGDGIYADRESFPFPSLLLLDLKMPYKNGFEVLTWIRKQPGIRGLPVIVLTSSEELRDVNQAYALGANSFLVKPLDFENSLALIRMVEKYWIRSCKLPETSRPKLKPSSDNRS